RVSRGGRKRADAETLTRRLAGPLARSTGARRAGSAQARTGGGAGRRRFLAPNGHAAGRDRRARPPARRAGVEAPRPAGAGRRADAGGLDPGGVGGKPARARPARRGGAACPPARRAASGSRRNRVRLRLHRRRGRSVVTPAGTESTAGSARRLNQPQRVLVEAHVDGSPRRVNRSAVALVREEWRVVEIGRAHV